MFSFCLDSGSGALSHRRGVEIIEFADGAGKHLCLPALHPALCPRKLTSIKASVASLSIRLSVCPVRRGSMDDPNKKEGARLGYLFPGVAVSLSTQRSLSLVPYRVCGVVAT